MWSRDFANGKCLSQKNPVRRRLMIDLLLSLVVVLTFPIVLLSKPLQKKWSSIVAMEKFVGPSLQALYCRQLSTFRFQWSYGSWATSLKNQWSMTTIFFLPTDNFGAWILFLYPGKTKTKTHCHTFLNSLKIFGNILLNPVHYIYTFAGKTLCP